MQTASSAIATCSASRSASEYTATTRTPILRAVLIMRQAISPRFAIRIFLNIEGQVSGVYVSACLVGNEQRHQAPDNQTPNANSQRYIPMLPPRILQFLVPQHRQRPANSRSSLPWHDHVVDVPT